jgi:cytochrome bd-type quinol oxidase subunit 1
MSELRIWTFSVIGISALLYLPAAFAAWDVNPANWHEDLRGAVGLLWMVLVPMAASYPGWRSRP